MSRLAIQIFVAAVFLTTIISATTLPNPRCSNSYKCENSDQFCKGILSHSLVPNAGPGEADGICFDNIRPGKITNDAWANKFGHEKGETIAQARLSWCSSMKQLNSCSSCCINTIIGGPEFEFHIAGEVLGKICLCKLIKR